MVGCYIVIRHNCFLYLFFLLSSLNTDRGYHWRVVAPILHIGRQQKQKENIMPRKTQPLFMFHLSTETHIGPDVWADASAGRRFFKDPSKCKWLADQMAHADQMLNITFKNEEDVFWDSQVYRLDLALDYFEMGQTPNR